MVAITHFLKAVFNFFVGDWIILFGVAITLIVVALLENIAALDSLKTAGGYILFIGVALTLAVTLRRETGH
jgi:hypothetical protein